MRTSAGGAGRRTTKRVPHAASVSTPIFPPRRNQPSTATSDSRGPLDCRGRSFVRKTPISDCRGAATEFQDRKDVCRLPLVSVGRGRHGRAAERDHVDSEEPRDLAPAANHGNGDGDGGQSPPSYLRVIIICPFVNGPVQTLEPVYVPVIVMWVPSTSPVPVACAAHPPDIMLPMGMSSVNVIWSPEIVPENAPAIMLGIPAKLIEPVTVDPFCVSTHVIVPIPPWPIMAPVPMELLESEAAPDQVPFTDIGPDGEDGIVTELLPHAAPNPIRKIATNALLISLPSFERTRRTKRGLSPIIDPRRAGLPLRARWPPHRPAAMTMHRP